MHLKTNWGLTITDVKLFKTDLAIKVLQIIFMCAKIDMELNYK